MLYQTPGAAIDFGWTVIGPLLLMVALFALSVPVWVALGLCSVALLLATDVLADVAVRPGAVRRRRRLRADRHPALYPHRRRAGAQRAVQQVDRHRRSDARARCARGSAPRPCSAAGSSPASPARTPPAPPPSAASCTSGWSQRGYPPAYACALVASGSCTGILIPPSISYIIIGLVLGISASTLFVAAAVPGIMIMVSIMVTNVVLNRINGYENSDAHFSFRRWLRTVWDGRYALAIPIIIWGGIYSGVFTPTEAAAAAVVVTIAIGLWQGTLTLADFPRCWNPRPR